MASAHRRKTHLFMLLLVVSNVLGNVALSRGLRHTHESVTTWMMGYGQYINFWTVVGVCILIVWTVTDLAVLSRADLTYVLPVAASANVLLAIAGHFLLHERISITRWLGILIISGGVLLAESTPDRTTPELGPER